MKVAFASCAKIQDFPEQPAWQQIEDEQPDYLLLLGDNVYGSNNKRDIGELRQRYEEQFDEPNFRSLVGNPQVKVHAIWDDHDFGTENEHGAEFDDEDYKTQAKDLFFEFMLFGQRDSAEASEIYHAFEDEAADVKFIMLDNRLYSQEGGAANTLLGEKQEAWFEEQLDQSQREITLVCAGLTLEGTKPVHEKWRDYKAYYDNITQAFREKGKVLFLSGDVHENAFVDHGGFFEAISSAVGRGGLIDTEIRNNYGIVEVNDESVDIRLCGVRDDDKINTSIDRATWTLR